MVTVNPDQQPSIGTDRLLLRPFTLADAGSVQALAGAPEVAATTLLIPHPYPDGGAEAWIETHAPGYASGEMVLFAIVDRQGGQLLGAIGLTLALLHARGELGYWIGVPFWNRGYATEAAAAVLRFGFEGLKLARIFAHHFSRNSASGRVMQKLAMSHEGRLRQHVRKWDRFEDLEVYGLLRAEWLALGARRHEPR
jgi:[ribosomal protein S5]-alanine N-acetyltransferase